MADKTITSANSIFTLTAGSVFPVPQQLSGYAVDSAFAADALVLAETRVGVDGRLSAGYTPTSTKMTVSLAADSPSRAIFMAITQFVKTQREVIFLAAHITLPATGEVFTCNRGVLTVSKQMPDAKKVLEATEYEIVFESVDRSVI